MHELSGKQRAGILLSYFGLYLGVYQLFGMAFLYSHLSRILFDLADILCEVLFLLLMNAIAGRWMKDQLQSFHSHEWKNTATALLTMVLIDLYAVFMMSLLSGFFSLGEVENQANNLTYQSINPPGFILTSVVFAPFYEELVFRGCIYAPLRKKHGFLLSAAAAGALFGIMHMAATVVSGNWINLLYFFVYAGCGFLLAFPYEASGSIITSMMSHSFYNLLGVLAVFLG